MAGTRPSRKFGGFSIVGPLAFGVPESPRVSEDLPVGLSLHILLDGLVIHALAGVFEVRIDLVGAGVVELLGGARQGP